MLRESLEPEVAARHWEVIAEFDGSVILPSVKAPTLVLVAGSHDSEIASAVTSLIPDARLVNIEDDWAIQTSDPSQLVAAIRNFLDEEQD